MNVPKSAAKPPGRRLVKRLSLRTKFTLLAIAGIVLILVGLSFMVNANALRLDGVPTPKWMILGVYSFVMLSAGLLVFGQAFRFRLLIDFRRETRREINRLRKRMEVRRNKDLETLQKLQAKTKNPTK